MCPTPSSVGRTGLKAFRLSDVDPGIRERAKSLALKREDSFVERVKIGLAAEQPSDRVYWIPRPAWDRVMGKRRARR
jgi:hypothetical protein